MKMNKILAALLLALSISVAPLSAAALSLDEAKRSGAVGEKRDGYLAVVDAAAPGAQALVDEINRKRRDAYAAIAKKNGSPVQVVEQVGAKEAVEKSPSGTMIQSASGGWEKKR